MPNDRTTPPPEVLAAIAAAYRLVAARSAPPALPEASRWRVAARLGLDDLADVRELGRVRSRWNAAGRRDD